MKTRLVKHGETYLLQTKKNWFSRWTYVKGKDLKTLPIIHESKRAAQAHLNLINKQLNAVQYATKEITH